MDHKTSRPTTARLLRMLTCILGFALPGITAASAGLLPGSHVRTLADHAPDPVVLASEKGKCIYRCRILREECTQDNALQSRSDDVCWDDYATCRSSCGDTSPVGDDISDNGGTTDPGSSTPEPDFVELSPTVIPVGKWAEGIVFDGNAVWVAESGQRSVARIDLYSGRVVERPKVGRLPVDMASTGDGDVYALVHTDQLIWSRSGNGRTRTLARLGTCPESMIEFGQMLYVVTLPACSSESSQLVRVDPRSGRMARTGILGEWAQALTGYNDKIWIAHARAPAITIVDVNSMETYSFDAPGTSLWSITANSTHIFAGGRQGDDNNLGVIVMFDANGQNEVHRATTSERIANIIADSDHVVAIGGSGSIWVFSAHTLELQRTISLTTGGFEPRAAIFNEDNILISVGQYAGGENGAILALGDWRPLATHGPASTGGSPGFNCATVRNDAERAICDDPGLAALDRDMNAEYALAASNITSAAVGGTAADVAQFQREQQAWLRRRDRCGSNIPCLTRSYRARLRILNEMNQPE